MKNVEKQYLEIISEIFNGDISYADKWLINKKCDKVWSEINTLRESKTEEINEIDKKYRELIALLEIERFAQGAKFMYNLMYEMFRVKG